MANTCCDLHTCKSELNLTVAGKVFNQGGSAKSCLQPGLSWGDKTTVNCTTKDKGPTQTKVGSVNEITHGISSQSSISAGQLINPIAKTYFQQRMLAKKESGYASKMSPLGKSRTVKQSSSYFGIQPDNSQLYGNPTLLDIEAGKIINPEKTRKEVEAETKAGHDHYVVTHHDYDVGEMIDRKYKWSSNPRTTRFGVETPHYNDGRNMAETLRWLYKKRPEKTTTLVAKRVDDFRERTQPQLGKVHDPISDTLNVPNDHPYGIIIKPDQYGVGDLLHMRSPRNYLLGKDRERGVLATVRQQLKKANYHNFSDLRSAFEYYDKDKLGYLDAQKIRDACWKFNLPIDNDLLASLMHYCRVDPVEDSEECKLDYINFVNFLNWKDKFTLPEKEQETDSQKKDSVPTLCKQIDDAMTNHLTSSSNIDAVAGKVNTSKILTNGVPTVRSDLPAPRTRRISDHTNYGDESDAYGLVNPSIYTRCGVYERDFFEPRVQGEIRAIFEAIGVQFSDETFGKIWKLAVQWNDCSSEGEELASVEAFRKVLEKLQASDKKDETP